jgi:uncharacterized protein (TIGR04141 family)
MPSYRGLSGFCHGARGTRLLTAMARAPRLRRLTISLLKEGLERSAAIRDPDDAASFRVPAIDAERDALFVSATDPHPPWWEDFLDPHVDGELAALFTASSSAVLLIEAAGRLFAVTFGQGRHLLDADALEQDFGLKVVLNTVRADQLKSVDAKTIDETTLHTRRDVSRDSAFSAFGLDVTRDLLRAVTGTPPDESLARRLTGSDALALNTRAQVPELPALAERLLQAYGSDAYKANFDFIDYLRPEKRAGRLRDLEQRLVDALNLREIDDAHLACPEPMDWLDVRGFRYSPKGDDELDADPRISAYLDMHDDELDLETLKADRLYAIRDADGEPLRVWPIYRCLVYQTEVAGDLYVLSAGEWFRVSLEFKDKVYVYAEALPETDLALPEADRNTDEDRYNRKAAEAIDGLLLDKQLVFGDGPDKMEICDVLTRKGTLIHIKQRGSSSTLSHLFAQGLNCAERLLEDPEFRAGARAVVEGLDPGFGDVLPVGQPDPQAFEVAFVVLTRSTRDTPLTLPFFSVVSLRSAAMRLRALGYRVSVKAVREPV